jgi:pyridoxal phosphate enzyme (YggS family)
VTEPASEIPARLDEVRSRIERAALGVGRDPSTVHLVAVSKGQSPEKIRAAYAAGQRLFGENYAQELQAKASELADLVGLAWHFTGHLQSNKAKLVAPIVALVQTLDSESLARELVKRAPAHRPRALLEVNIGGETQKGGVPPRGALDVARALLGVPGLELLGLMCVPPEGEPPRPAFARLRELRDSLALSLGHSLPELSMGMSSDFEEAVQEGATMVRVGTAIFGQRG